MDGVYHGSVSENGGLVEVSPEIKAKNGPICGYRIVNSHKGKIPFEVWRERTEDSNWRNTASPDILSVWLMNSPASYYVPFYCRFSCWTRWQAQHSWRPDILSTANRRRNMLSPSLPCPAMEQHQRGEQQHDDFHVVRIITIACLVLRE